MNDSSTQVETLVFGEWVTKPIGQTFAVLDPADLRRTVAQVPALGSGDIRAVYDGAELGARDWAATDPIARGAILFRAAGLLRERISTIAADLVQEMGKTLAEATVEVTKAADFFEYYGGLARDPAGYGLNDARPNTIAGVRREPIGIVLAITPWNDPLLTPARKLAPALACGNAVVLKPASETPLVAIHLAHALTDAGLPAKVLSVVTGRGSDLSEPLLSDERIAAVTFTGSNEVGSRIRSTVALRNLRLQTEMGGKNAAVVLPDADLDLAAATVSAAAFAQAGQRCTATSRVIAHREIARPFTELLIEQVAALRMGPGSDPLTNMGPVVSASQQSSVLTAIRAAIDDGCQLVTGSAKAPGGALEHGSFVGAALLTGVDPNMSIWSNEVFGPVVGVVEVDDFDQACSAVNDSAYGLSAAVFTRDLRSAYEFINRVDVGQVSVNLPTSGWDVHQPFGGFRDSGSPFKEQGVEALTFYTRTKTYAVRYG